MQDSSLICHNVSNTVLLELVTTLQDLWSPGLAGVSVAVASVIQDYTANMPRVLGSSLEENINHKLIRLKGKPWRCESSEGRTGDGERLQAAIIGCVTKLGYMLSMDITLDIETNTRVFFLIKTTGDDTGNLVTVPNTSGKKSRTSSSLASFTQSCSQSSPLSLVESQRLFALIGRDGS